VPRVALVSPKSSTVQLDPPRRACRGGKNTSVALSMLCNSSDFELDGMLLSLEVDRVRVALTISGLVLACISAFVWHRSAFIL